jgi:hypothetical protein
MDIFVNTDPYDPPPDAATVNDVINAVQVGDDDRLIVALRLDGSEVAQDALARTLATSIAAAGRLEIDVDSARRLASQTLGEAANVLEETRDQYVRIAELLAAGKTDDAMALLNECFAIWNTAEQSLRQSSQVAGIDLNAAGTLPEPPAAMIERFGDVLKRVQESLTARDFVAVADLVEYDMADITDSWQCMLVALQQQLLAH